MSLFQHFQNFVLEEYAAGRRVALIVDEAQNLGPEMLEELRMLTNINSGKDELLQIILVGQPELRDLITRPELRQFAQRVTATFHIDPFSRADTEEYIMHRLKHAGGSGEEFDHLAIRHIYEHSEGIPRVINKLCDLSLVYAASSDQERVSPETVREVFADGLVLKAERNPIYLAPHLEDVKKANE